LHPSDGALLVYAEGLWRKNLFQYPDALHELNRVMAAECAEIALACPLAKAGIRYSRPNWWNIEQLRSNLAFGMVDANNPGFLAGDAYQ